MDGWVGGGGGTNSTVTMQLTIRHLPSIQRYTNYLRENEDFVFITSDRNVSHVRVCTLQCTGNRIVYVYLYVAVNASGGKNLDILSRLLLEYMDIHL
jgi:hypothetical protein